jgi:hypothetical protein
MAYWLHCQFCGEWSKSLTPLSDDQSCSFCSRPFKAIKPYPKAPAKPLASEPQDVRENVQKYDIEVAETDGLQKAEVKEVPEPVQQTSLLSGENNETSNVMASEATHTVEIPVNTEEQVQEVEEIESSGERDSSEPLEPGDKPEVSEIPELPETLLIDEEPAVVDKDANDEPEVIPQAEEPIPATDANNAVEIAETNQIGETSQEEKELMGSEGTDEPKKSEMHINFIFETPQTTATPKQFEEITNQEDSGAAEVMETDQEDSGAAEVMETDQEDGGAAEAMETDQEDSGAAEAMETDQEDSGAAEAMETDQEDSGAAEAMETDQEDSGAAEVMETNQEDSGAAEVMETDQEDSGAAETMEIDKVRDYKENPKLRHSKKEPDLVTEAADENENKGDNLIRPEQNADKVPMWLDILDTPETGKIRITFTYGTPRAESKAKEPEVSETAESGAALETIEEKAAPEALATLPLESESGEEATGIKAGGEEASEAIDFSESAEKETISEKEEAEDKQEAPQAQEFSSIEIDDAEDKSALSELPDDAGDNPALPELPDDAEDKPALPELSDDTEDNPALPESPDDAGDNSALSELSDDAEDNPALPESPDDAGDNSALPEPPDDAGDKPALSELSDDAEDNPALPELPDDAEDKSALPELPDDAGNKSAMCELSDDADSGGDTEASKRLDDTMEPGESTDEERSEPELNEPLSGLEEKHDAESETTETGQEEEMPINRNPRMTRTYEPYIEMRRRTRNSQP